MFPLMFSLREHPIFSAQVSNAEKTGCSRRLLNVEPLYQYGYSIPTKSRSRDGSHCWLKREDLTDQNDDRIATSISIKFDNVSSAMTAKKPSR